MGRRLRQLSGASPLLVLACLCQLPRLGRADGAHPPRVELDKLSFDGEVAHAPIAGSDQLARLSLDRELQDTARRLLSLARPVEGAVVVVHVASGRVLALAERRRSGEGAQEVALAADSPAASVFKLVTTAALLERGHVSEKLEVCTAGGQRRIERRHLEAPTKGEALCAPFGQALGHSRNAAYAQLVTRHLARTDLADVAEAFGFNKPVPFDLPAPLGKLDVPYNDLAFARTAAGFSGVTLSPLGGAELALIVASGGHRVRLRVVESAGDGYRAPERATLLGRAVSARTSRRLARMMEVTVHGGTSLDAFTREDGASYLGAVRVAGKTGTLKPDAGSPTTSWFVGFAPARRPELAVSVMLGNGRVWRRKANEVARDLLRTYFARKGVRGITPPF